MWPTTRLFRTATGRSRAEGPVDRAFRQAAANLRAGDRGHSLQYRIDTGIGRPCRAFPQVPFVGTVPAIKPAAERTRSGLVSVLATPGTVKRQYTRDLITGWATKCHVRLVGSTRLAALAEIYMREGFVDEEAVRAEMPHASWSRMANRRTSLSSPARTIRFWSIACAKQHPGRSIGSIRPRP